MAFVPYLIGDLAWKAASVVVLAAASRCLTPEPLAAFLLSQSLLPLLVAGGDLGFKTIGVRMLSQRRAEAVSLQTDVQATRWAFALFAATATCAYALAIGSPAATVLFVVAYLPYFLSCDWLLLAQEQQGRIGLAKGVAALVLVAAAWLALSSAGEALPTAVMAAGYAVALAVTALLSGGTLPPWRADCFRRAYAFARHHAREAAALSAAGGATAAFHSADVLLLAGLQGTSETSSYAAAMRVLLPIYSIGWLVSQYLSPRFAQRAGRHDAAGSAALPHLMAFAAIGGSLALALLAVAPLVGRMVFADRWADLTQVLRVLAPTIVLDALACVLAQKATMAGRSVEVAKATTFGVLGLVGSLLALHAADLGLTGAELASAARNAAYVLLVGLLFRGALRGSRKRS
jgi:O-antigen/teichoic acid export membrane protein